MARMNFFLNQLVTHLELLVLKELFFQNFFFADDLFVGLLLSLFLLVLSVFCSLIELFSLVIALKVFSVHCCQNLRFS